METQNGNWKLETGNGKFEDGRGKRRLDV
jgi:hypothetical protein